MKRLTVARIDRLREAGRYADAEIKTLYLRVAPGGSKQWVQRLLIRGRRVDLGLGGYPLITLDEARQLAWVNRRKARAGGDPVGERQQSENVPTFKDAVEKVIALHQGTWKNPKQKKREWQTSFDLHVFPSLGRTRVCDIEARDVLRVVSAIWVEKNETAQKVKRRISAVLDWAVTRGYRSDNPVGAVNAALPKTVGKLKGNYKTIPHAEVAAAIAKTNASTAYASTKACFEFSILTATRSQEARGARWQEIDMDKRTWEIPGERTKTGRAFRVPLSSRALDILRGQKVVVEDSPLIFAAPRGGVMSDATISKLVRQNGIDGVPHAIARACFRSWCADVNIERELAEASLAHTVKGVEGRYQRSDLFERRRAVMQKWTDYLDWKKPAKVVNLR